jgi:hypothetical protein
MKRSWKVLAASTIAAAAGISACSSDNVGDKAASAVAQDPACSTRFDPRPKPPPTFIAEQPARLIAIGDVHGDYQAAEQALLLAGVIEVTDDVARWSGGCDVVVQTGDQLDRGPGEQKILDLFEKLADEAWEAGGAFYSLLGNHETMNARKNFKDVFPEKAWADFQNVSYDEAELLDRLDYEDVGDLRAHLDSKGYLPDKGFDVQDQDLLRRVAAFAPGGTYANLLAEHNATMVVGDTMFVHGGIHQNHVDYGLEKINREVQAYMRGDNASYTPSLFDRVGIMRGSNGVVWSREYSGGTREPIDAQACARLEGVLAAVGAQRIVVGHTIQNGSRGRAPRGINSVCGGKAWRIDTGMASYYDGEVWVLEIVGEKITGLN